jgi:hypothetical protein
MAHSWTCKVVYLSAEGTSLAPDPHKSNIIDNDHLLQVIPIARLSSDINASFQGEPGRPSIPRKEPESADKKVGRSEGYQAVERLLLFGTNFVSI